MIVLQQNCGTCIWDALNTPKTFRPTLQHSVKVAKAAAFYCAAKLCPPRDRFSSAAFLSRSRFPPNESAPHTAELGDSVENSAEIFRWIVRPVERDLGYVKSRRNDKSRLTPFIDSLQYQCRQSSAPYSLDFYAITKPKSTFWRSLDNASFPSKDISTY